MSPQLGRLRTLLILCAVIVTSLCLATPALGATVTINGVVYTTNDNTSTASASNNTVDLPVDVTIPSTITDGGITYNVTSIGDNAFDSATNLQSITIPNSVTSIGEYAFISATSLQSITIPNGVTSIGNGAFNDNPSLTQINVGDENQYYASTDGVLFNKSRTMIFAYPSGKTNTSYTIPNSVTSIGGGAFADAPLTSITIPNSVTSIGENAFSEVTSLTSITIPNSVTSIGGYAFTGATSLATVILGNSVTSIGESAFQGATGLTSVTFATPSSVTTIGVDAFNGATSLTSITIPNSVTTIGERAFQFATSLATIILGNSVTRIGTTAFTGTTSLQSYYFAGNAPTLGRDVFGDDFTATVYRVSTATGFGTNPTWNRMTLAYWLPAPAAPVATAGNASATIAITAPSAGPTPTTYTVAAVGDSTKTCTITTPATSCTINGLTNGTSYTFTAIAHTIATTTPDVVPALDSATSDTSNTVTPTVPADNATSDTSNTVTPTAPADNATTTPITALPTTSTKKVNDTTIVTTFTAPGPGIVRQIGTTSNVRSETRAASLTVCKTTKTITKAGKTTISCNLTKAAQRARAKNALTVALTTTFTPTSGTPMISTKTIRLARTPVAKAPARTVDTPSAVTG